MIQPQGGKWQNSGNLNGSPNELAARTFRATFLLPKRAKKTDEPPKEPRIYRNPVYVAREWLTLIHNDTYSSIGELARAKGLSTPRVSQVLKVLELAEEVIAMVESLGDPLPAPVVTERRLRLLVHLPVEDQVHQMKELLAA